MHPLPALLTCLSLIPFTAEEITGCTIKAAKAKLKSVNKAAENFPSCFLFHVLLFP